jgi:hypothetical protein
MARGTVKPSRFVGIDLTDCYATLPRAVDVAMLTVNAETARVDFCQFKWPDEGTAWEAEIVERVRRLGGDDTVFIVDGPQALARKPNKTRGAERCLGAPGHTPCQPPEPGKRPFAGFIKTSVRFFNALVNAGFRLAELTADDKDSAKLFEAYPGAVWARWYRGEKPLQRKQTREGLHQRRAILERVGCNFAPASRLTHDQLDAAVCAALGWRYFFPRAEFRVELAPQDEPNSAVSRDDNGVLREGRILMPVKYAESNNSPLTDGQNLSV